MFPPAFAPRMGYLCKYLKRAGWKPVVVTEAIHENMFSFLEGNATVTYVNYYTATGKMAKRLEWMWIMFLDFFFNYKDRKMYKIAADKVNQGGFSGVLCSTYRTFPLPVAQRIAKQYNLPWVADTRDIIEQYASNEFIAHSFKTFPWLDKQIVALFRRKLLNKRNKALQAADCITTVSPWHVGMMKQYNSRTQLIYNGYDPELFYPEKIKTAEFSLVFTGRLVSLAIRDPRLLFEAIRQLSEEKFIQPSSFRVRWYMDEKSDQLIRPLAEQYGITEYMDYQGYVPADQIPDILNQSSILLQLANVMKEDGPKGIMSTKLFEAMAVEKPLLCVRSDERYLEETIRKANAGVSARTVEDILPFLRHYYTQWKEQGYTTVDVNREVVESFSRKKQAEQFMQLFADLNK